MQIGKVYSNDIFVGILYRKDGSIVFEYAQAYIDSPLSYDISVNLPRIEKKFISEYLHPFFLICFRKGA